MSVAQALVKVTSKYNLAELEEIRYKLLLQMKQKGFAHYFSQMKRIKEKVAEIVKLDDDANFLDDDYWTSESMMFKKEIPWWVSESAGINVDTEKSATASIRLTEKVLKENMINSLLDNKAWITPQQRLFFTTLILMYYKINDRLVPIGLNIDMTMLAQSQKTFFYRGFNVEEHLKMQGLKLIQKALAGSGPFMLKILQQLGNSATAGLDIKSRSNRTVRSDKEIVAELTSSVFDAVPPLNAREFDLVTSNIDIPRVYLENLDPKPLGSASLAQAHNTKDVYKQPVIIKILRPIYAYYYLCECDFLLTQLWVNLREKAEIQKPGEKNMLARNLLVKQSRQMLMFLLTEFISEFDYMQEAMYNIIGYARYNQPKQYILSAQMIQFATNPFPAIIQTKAGDNSLKEIMNNIEKSVIFH